MGRVCAALLGEGPTALVFRHTCFRKVVPVEYGGAGGGGAGLGISRWAASVGAVLFTEVGLCQGAGEGNGTSLLLCPWREESVLATLRKALLEE